METKHIALIGMSGVGKSHVGRLVADHLGWDCIDTDRLLEAKEQKTLPEIVAACGSDDFIAQEAVVIESLNPKKPSIIATGGSVVYAKNAMEHLKRIATIIYLSASAEYIARRTDVTTRGIVGLDAHTFTKLYDERRALYEKYAEKVVLVEGKTREEIVAAICG